MKLKKFSNKIKLQKYLKNNVSKHLLYTIISERRFLFWKKIVVLFFNEEEITQKLNLILKDVIETEFKINIRDIYYDFEAIKNKKINIKLNTQNNELLIGKFEQNRKSLVLFIQKTLFQFYKTLFDIDLVLKRQKKRKK